MVKGWVPLSSASNKWRTPPDFYAMLDQEFHFDPCPIDWDPATHPDGLTIPWAQTTFCNPPYRGIGPWIKKAHDEWLLGKTVVLLVNAWTDSAWFHDYIYGRAEIRFIRGRLKFLDADGTKMPCGFRPSMVVVFRSPPGC